jgi:hypothetical protein
VLSSEDAHCKLLFGEQALAQHVLHRLTEAEVDAERQCRHELGQADLRPVRIAAHRTQITLGRA